jgi:lipopolysaccharide transport system ATP-binding protein
MSDIAIRVQNLGKRFELGELGTATDFLRKSKSLVKRVCLGSSNGRASDRPWEHETDPDIFWALKGIDFEVREGEVLGIIGANGAGKSTLLKILSRITGPTVGHIELYGRIAALLEVGTGFHGELTGRENVYLNGSILGMSRAEIRSKLDEIIDFAGVEKFIDTPVKRYSSGMRVRLGFAVAAHLEPEILIIDEVLAVGDTSFKTRCINKMREVARSGRTVLLVSHNMSSIMDLCERCLWIHHGEVLANEETGLVTNRYMAQQVSQAHSFQPNVNQTSPYISSVSIHDPEGNPTDSVRMGDAVEIRINVHAPRGAACFLAAGISIEDSLGARIASAFSGREGVDIRVAEGDNEIAITFSRVTLMPGSYVISAGLRDDVAGARIDAATTAARFEVLSMDMAGAGHQVRESDGQVWLDRDWHVRNGIAPTGRLHAFASA